MSEVTIRHWEHRYKKEIGKRLTRELGAIHFRCPYCEKPHLSAETALSHYKQMHLKEGKE